MVMLLVDKTLVLGLTKGHQLDDQLRVGNVGTTSFVITYCFTYLWVHTCHLVCKMNTLNYPL